MSASGPKNGKPDQGAVSAPAAWASEAEGWLASDAARYWLIVGIAFAVAVIFRALFLHADPPWNFTWSQDLFTDGARVVDGARNKEIFGRWITDPRSPEAVFYPLPTLIAWIIFKIGGVGLAQANLTGVFPGLAALAMMFYTSRKLEGDLGGLLGLTLLGFAYLHVIYSRVPMVESLLVLMLLASFWLTFGGRRNLFLAGLVIGIASFMVKLHAIHFVPVAVVYLLVCPRSEDDGKPKRSHLVASFLAGFVVGFAVWLGAIYAQHSTMLNKYYASNVVISQKEDYSGLSFYGMAERRVAGIIHGGAGRDGFVAKTAEISILAWIGLLGLASRFALRKPTIKPWELLSAIWFIGLMAALGLLSYRPLRYFALLTPSVCFLSMSLLLRLARGEQVISSPRPKWFIYAFGFWLGWVILHVQQEIVFQVMTGGKVVLVNEMNAFQKSLYKYQFMVFPQLLIFGGLAVALTMFFHDRISRGKPFLPAPKARRLFNVAVVVVVLLGVLRFGLYAAERRYSVVEAGKSLTRVFSKGVFMAGDCSSILSLDTDFRTLPSYGDLIRHKEKALFEQYPITHFILRFPTLFEYMSENYPNFEEVAVPVRIFSLCGREATIVRYVDWPGYASSGYTPTEYERGVELLHIDDVEGARDLFRQFLTGHPDSYEAVWGLALCEFRDGNLSEAKTLIERALDMTDRDELIYEAYGDILDALGERFRAAEYFRKALELSPNSRRLARKLQGVMG